MKNNSPIIMLTMLFLTVSVLVTACQPENTHPSSTTVPSVQQSPTAPQPTTPPLPAATPTLNLMPDEDEIHAAIVNALLALNTQPNRADITTELVDGKTQKSIIEFIPPDRKHIVSLDDAVEYIVIGDTVYMKTNTSGKWEQTKIPGATFLEDGEVTAQSIGETIQDVQWVRSDELGGKAINVYKYNSTTHSNNIELNSQTELWVGVEDDLPYQMVIDGEILQASTDPSSGESKLQAAKALTTTIITFDPAMQIELPD